MAVSVTVTIVNRKGLHARAAAKFVRTVSHYKADIRVQKLGGEEGAPPVVGSSILGLMMLGADPGSQLQIMCDGEDEATAMNALKELIEGRFGEPE